MKRVGHGGASAIARGNTLESFDAALELRVDMIEFDVRAHRGDLLLAHTRLHACTGRYPTLDQALAHLSARRFRDVELNLDLKSPGCAPAVVDAVQRFGLRDRVLISSQLPVVVDRCRALDERIGRAISIGGHASRWCQRWGDWQVAVLEALAAGRFRALMANHRIVSQQLSESVKERGGELFAWTVDDHRLIGHLARLGVDGVITNDPRLFALAGEHS